MNRECFGASISRRFRAPGTRTIFARTVSEDPIAISRVVSLPVRTEPPPLEAAFSIHVQTGPTVRAEIYVDGRPAGLRPQHPGAVRLFDLATRPWARLHDPAEFLRIHMTQRTLDDLSYDRGERPAGGLRPTLNTEDPVLHGLCCALTARFEIYGPEDCLFVDQVALAFHAHIVQTYGNVQGATSRHGGLAPWQLRRACAMMVANLKGDVAMAELAEACGLSLSYFAHAFRRTAGLPPHKWLMNERVSRAKDLLRDGALTLPEIAIACGFADQSHFTRVFARKEGQTPGRWRRLRRS